MISLRTLAAVLLFLGVSSTGNAAELDPSSDCVFHVRKGEHFVLPSWLTLQFDAAKMPAGKTAWCVDDGASVEFSNQE